MNPSIVSLRNLRTLVFAAVFVAAAFAEGADAVAVAPAFEPNHLFVGCRANPTGGPAVFEFDETGVFVRRIDIPTTKSGDQCYGVAFGPDGALYCSAYDTDRVLRIDASLSITTYLDAADGVDAPVGVAFGPGGRLYVANRVPGGTVLAADAAGHVVGTYTAPSAKYPSWITFGAAGHAFVSTYA
jgi:DNA-binding beta-propeller fold protein YncE